MHVDISTEQLTFFDCCHYMYHAACNSIAMSFELYDTCQRCMKFYECDVCGVADWQGEDDDRWTVSELTAFFIHIHCQ